MKVKAETGRRLFNFEHILRKFQRQARRGYFSIRPEMVGLSCPAYEPNNNNNHNDGSNHTHT
jgi:hypothetical protein